ncbi:protein kinase (incomplete catalytic triad) [Cyclospora cayetanensis]|uniref:Protein kinase (Incomplete catalytic triad) n=1 Tax=Cyclospora cayetanensis TaxID=88456 RepID=A0A1D3CVW3_9EIME|nr:protein kinase (incomplete catalytic triad) [Cyclospora cayetanensis]
MTPSSASYQCGLPTTRVSQNTPSYTRRIIAAAAAAFRFCFYAAHQREIARCTRLPWVFLLFGVVLCFDFAAAAATAAESPTTAAVGSGALLSNSSVPSRESLPLRGSSATYADLSLIRASFSAAFTDLRSAGESDFAAVAAVSDSLPEAALSSAEELIASPPLSLASLSSETDTIDSGGSSGSNDSERFEYGGGRNSGFAAEAVGNPLSGAESLIVLATTGDIFRVSTGGSFKWQRHLGSPLAAAYVADTTTTTTTASSTNGASNSSSKRDTRNGEAGEEIHSGIGVDTGGAGSAALYLIEPDGTMVALQVTVPQVVNRLPFKAPLFPGVYFVGRKEARVRALDLATSIWQLWAVDALTHERLWGFSWIDVSGFGGLPEPPRDVEEVRVAETLKASLRAEGDLLYMLQRHPSATAAATDNPAAAAPLFLKFPAPIAAVYAGLPLPPDPWRGAAASAADAANTTAVPFYVSSLLPPPLLSAPQQQQQLVPLQSMCLLQEVLPPRSLQWTPSKYALETSTRAADAALVEALAVAPAASAPLYGKAPLPLEAPPGWQPSLLPTAQEQRLGGRQQLPSTVSRETEGERTPCAGEEERRGSRHKRRLTKRRGAAKKLASSSFHLSTPQWRREEFSLCTNAQEQLPRELQHQRLPSPLQRRGTVDAGDNPWFQQQGSSEAVGLSLPSVSPRQFGEDTPPVPLLRTAAATGDSSVPSSARYPVGAAETGAPWWVRPLPMRAPQEGTAEPAAFRRVGRSCASLEEILLSAARQRRAWILDPAMQQQGGVEADLEEQGQAESGDEQDGESLVRHQRLDTHSLEDDTGATSGDSLSLCVSSLSPPVSPGIPARSALLKILENGKFARTFAIEKLVGRGGFGTVYEVC